MMTCKATYTLPFKGQKFFCFVLFVFKEINIDQKVTFYNIQKIYISHKHCSEKNNHSCHKNIKQLLNCFQH